MGRRRLRRFIGIGILALAYYGAARLGLSLAFVQDQATPVWPPAGIALAALLLFGAQFWPGVAAGAFFGALSTHAPLAVAILVAAGNTLGALAGVYLLQRAAFRKAVDRWRDVAALVFLAAPAGAALSATIGVTGLGLSGLMAWSAFGSVWWTWWIGDTMGSLIVAPALLAWSTRAATGFRVTGWRAVEGASLLLLVVLVSQAIFTDTRPAAYLVLVCVVWGAFRFEQRGATGVTLVASVIAVWNTTHGLGPFTAETQNQNLIDLAMFLGTIAVSGLALAAAVSGQKRSEQALRQANDWLELRVRERTTELGRTNLQLERELGERKQVEAALRDSEERYRTLFDTMLNGFALHEIICDASGRPSDYRFLDVNPAFEQMTGLRRDRVVGKTVREVLPGTEAYWIETYGQVALSGNPMRFENYSAEIDKHFEVIAYSPRRGQFAVTFTDITQRMQAQEGLRYLATHDPLTGLPNRKLFRERLDQALAKAGCAGRRESGPAVAVMWLDLDSFKRINDTLGHPKGDEVLCDVAAKLRACVEESDTVARMGGDEFAILLGSVPQAGACVPVARSILEALAAPMTLAGYEYRIGCSIGISLFPFDGADADALLMHADAAMYQAKQQHDCYRFYSDVILQGGSAEPLIDQPVRRPSIAPNP